MTAIAIPPTAKFTTTALRSPIDRPSAAFVGAWVAITAPASVAAVSAMMRSMRSLLGGGRAPHATSATDGPGMQEALVAWAVWGVVAIGVWETYARFPADRALQRDRGAGSPAAPRARSSSSTGRSRSPASRSSSSPPTGCLPARARAASGGRRGSSRRPRRSRSARRSRCPACSTATTSTLGRRNIPAAVGVLLALAHDARGRPVRGTGARAPLDARRPAGARARSRC